jgi:hypothetical protein
MTVAMIPHLWFGAPVTGAVDIACPAGAILFDRHCKDVQGSLKNRQYRRQLDRRSIFSQVRNKGLSV